MSDEMKKGGGGKLIREIHSLTLVHRIGQAGTLDADIEILTARDCELQPEEHRIFGAGVRVKWRSRAGFSKFVPISNVRDVQYTEREETPP